MRTSLLFVASVLTACETSTALAPIPDTPPGGRSRAQLVSATCASHLDTLTIHAAFDVEIEPNELFTIETEVLAAPTLESMSIPPTTFACGAWERLKAGTNVDAGCKRLPDAPAEQRIEMTRVFKGTGLIENDVSTIVSVLTTENGGMLTTTTEQLTIACTRN